MTVKPELTTRILAARAAQRAAQERYDLAQRDGAAKIIDKAAKELSACTRAVDVLLEQIPRTT